jgi:carotenoid cleavage dioxygenase-like enzyme
MATLTTNLFHGQGERDHHLDVVEGHWPTDIDGSVLVVGPDKRAPGGHWFGEAGILEQIRLVPDPHGRIAVRHRVIDTPVQRLKRRLGFLFRTVAFLEMSPFGVTNLANTNVQSIEGRLFVGYDAGRPIEVDPETLRFITPVGTNAEWLQGAPGLFEPLCAVAAHPAPDIDERALYFVNYTQIAPPGVPKETWLARWPLDGPVRRWRVDGMSEFDSIHDISATEHHLVFTDLPFVVEPETFRGAPRQRRIQEHTNLWIVAKRDLGRTPPGGSVPAVEVRLPMPTGHLFVDHAEVDGRLRVTVQHAPLGDLLVAMTAETVDHRHGRPVDPDYQGMVALTLQPSVVGRYEIDAATGEVLDADTALDADRVWGGILPATDETSPAARDRHRQLWYAGAGFDPDLIPGSLSRFDLDAMKVAEVWSYGNGAFPSPPTFVPRAGATDPDDGYIVVVVHQDGDKEIQIFDAHHLEAGPLARATAPGFHPALLLHSCWMADRVGPRPSTYRVAHRADVAGALRGIPGVLARTARMVAATARHQRATRRPPP